jgi:hypothetical protein
MSDRSFTVLVNDATFVGSFDRPSPQEALAKARELVDEGALSVAIHDWSGSEYRLSEFENAFLK